MAHCEEKNLRQAMNSKSFANPCLIYRSIQSGSYFDLIVLYCG